MSERKSALSSILQKKSVLIFLLAAGLLLLLWPKSSGSGSAEKNEDVFTNEEKRLCAVLSKIDGVGNVYALLSEEANRRGEYTGAVVVCSGAGSPDTRLRVIQAVSAFTGLGSNRIIVEELIS
ncbi:MAG: hypothetical protein PUJ35_02380 [Ruminococcus bromii]|nr:hypothetical protein [Ruminococcus bromii]